MTNDKQAGFCSNSWVPSKHLCPPSALQASALSDDGHKVTSLTSANLVWPSLELFPFARKPWVWSHGWNKSPNSECVRTIKIVQFNSELCGPAQNVSEFSFIFLFNGLNSLFLTTALKGHRTVWSNYIKMLNAFFIFHIPYFMLQSAYVMLHISCSSLPLLRSRWLAASYFIFDNWHLTFFVLKFTCQRDIIDTKRHISYPYLYLCFWQYRKIFYL